MGEEYWQGTIDARLTLLEATIKEMSSDVKELLSFRSKMRGLGIGVSAFVSACVALFAAWIQRAH